MKLKDKYNKARDKQAELPYRLEKYLKAGWTGAKKKSSSFRKFAKGVETVKQVGKKIYKSKASKTIGNYMDKIEKIPFVGGELKNGRNFVRKAYKDPFAVQTNLGNFAKLVPVPFGGPVGEILFGAAKDKLIDKMAPAWARREKRARDRVNNSGKTEAKPYNRQPVTESQAANMIMKRPDFNINKVNRRKNSGIKNPLLT